MNGRLISAEVLRLRKSRALVIWLTVLTTGAVTAFFLIAQGFHINNSAQNGPAGGASLCGQCISLPFFPQVERLCLQRALWRL